MKVVTHAIISFILALVFYPIVGLYSTIIFFSGFIFDVDHLIWYYIHYKSLNITKCWEYCNGIGSHRDTKRMVRMFFVFHNWEFILVMLLGGFLWEGFLFIGIGAGLHLLLDIYDRYRIFGVVIPGSAIHYFLTKPKHF